MRISFVRHGEAESNVDIANGIVGSDRPITKEGIEQVRKTAQWMLGHVAVSQIFTSPKKRGVETAEIIGEAYGLEPLVDRRLDEVYKGAWTGQPVPLITHIEDNIPFAERPTYQPPGGGERWFDIGARVISIVEEMRYRAADDTLLVTHIEPIRMGIGMLMRTPADHWRDTDIANASFTQIVYNDRWSLDPSRYNVTPYKES